MRKVMLLAAMLAMVLVAAAPVMAQDDDGIDDDSINNSGNVAIDGQYQEQNCAVIVDQFNNASAGDAVAADEAVAGTAAAVNAPVEVVQNCLQAGGDIGIVEGGEVVYGEAVYGEYYYEEGEAHESSDDSSSSASESYSVLPDTGGASLIALGAGALLVAGGLLARKIVR